jgi:nitrite reductase/ring-hydroxylating ferredoxin subunit
MSDSTAESTLIDERQRNEVRGIIDRKYLTCEKYGDIFEVRDGLACLHPKATCKFRLNCPIYIIGKLD